MPYWRLFYHLVWATQGREALIDDELVPVIERSLRTSCLEQRGIPFAAGVMPDHVHVAAAIPPSVAVSRFVGRLKGASSHAINLLDRPERSVFAWQSDYGALSFGEKALPDIVAYVENQHSRHADQHLWPALEHVTNGS